MKFVIEFDTYAPEEPNYTSTVMESPTPLEVIADSVREDFVNGSVYQFQSAPGTWQIIRMENVRAVRVREIKED